MVNGWGKKETVRIFFFLGSKITSDIETVAPCKTNYDKSRQRFKNWRHHLANKGPCVKAIVFPIVMNGCESWAIKKAASQRIDAFELWCWRRLLRVPWTTGRSSKSMLKEISPEYSLEGMNAEAEAPIVWPPDMKEPTHSRRP